MLGKAVTYGTIILPSLALYTQTTGLNAAELEL